MTRSRGASLVRANALHLPLADETVDLIVTSPPYFALRSYRDGDEHYDGQIGSEATPQAFLEALWAVLEECWRVLKPEGSCWVNLGDKRAGSGGHNNAGIIELALAIETHHRDVERAALDALEHGDTTQAAAVLREALEERR
jgi:DNA modification methylase